MVEQLTDVLVVEAADDEWWWVKLDILKTVPSAELCHFRDKVAHGAVILGWDWMMARYHQGRAKA